MAYQQSDLDALDSAIAQGVLRVRYNDKDVIYRSLQEMLQIRALIQKELAGPNAPTGKKYASFKSGINGGCR